MAGESSTLSCLVVISEVASGRSLKSNRASPPAPATWRCWRRCAGPRRVAGNAPSRFRNRSIRNSPVIEQRSVLRVLQYEQVLALDQLRIRGILVSSCARNPPSVVPKPAYGSASGTPHRPAKRHHVALAQLPLRHPRPASEGHRRLLSPWNYPAPANAATPHTDHLPTDPNASTPRQ